MLGRDGLEAVRAVKVYRLEGVTEAEAEGFARDVLAEPLEQRYALNRPLVDDARHRVEVAYRPGVTNPESASLLKAARHVGLDGMVAADSSWEYHFYGRVDDARARAIVGRLLVNDTVEHVVTRPPSTLLLRGDERAAETVALRGLDDDALDELSRTRMLYLSRAEMRALRDFFRRAGRDPVDVELETLAQTWSEHCSHKTFKSPLATDGGERPPLLMRLKDASRRHDANVLSSFEDNSGVIRLTDGWGVCGKVETHNSPSAIEPYGGAATGSGGVFRDIAGTGLGARCIASTDVFCLAPPDLAERDVPPGCLHPRYVLRRVVAGVRDYGNRMGIPTNNGSLHFHPDYRAKPSVIVGAYGIVPDDACRKGAPVPGDVVVVAGGRTGRDGIHGATFSSGEMTGTTSEVAASAVQIGNPVEEKRTFDALLACRDRGLLRALTDCGAGGFSSAIGEMGARTGVAVELERAPLKYSGLAPWEIWVSESQERMVAAVPPEHADDVVRVCAEHNVEATVLGTFTGDGRLVVRHRGRVVCDLPMELLHDGMPRAPLAARWAPPAYDDHDVPEPADATAELCRVLADPNVCSKEPVVRLYDHTVQGTNVVAPYGGPDGRAPNDGAVVTPLYGDDAAVAIAHGLHPALVRLDPYWGAAWAVTEALANFVAAGGDPRHAGLVDNFVWPVPDERLLGALDRCVDALVDAMDAFGVPFVSGKDSLSSTYRDPRGGVVEVPPTLCVSAFGPARVDACVGTAFAEPGSYVVLLGALDASSPGGSVYARMRDCGGALPRVDMDAAATRFASLHDALGRGLVRACHDVSEGGVAVALAEMCVGGGLGARVDARACGDGRADLLLFAEVAGCFVVEVAPDALDDLTAVLGAGPVAVLGRTTPARRLVVECDGELVIDASLERLHDAWARPMTEVFH
ncbi:MAG TPA: phosphoribosylformylglycinamidine synthase subunit PurL [Actinomycetota bacterium]|nr:phosphoribosylformylglycinamidine synthase subunit PurL [Actinomycetota bacterium]